MMGMDGVACFHSDPPVADEVLEEDLETVGMVVCAHAFGVGVYLADEGAWGHVNTPAVIPARTARSSFRRSVPIYRSASWDIRPLAPFVSPSVP